MLARSRTVAAVARTVLLVAAVLATGVLAGCSLRSNSAPQTATTQESKSGGAVSPNAGAPGALSAPTPQDQATPQQGTATNANADRLVVSVATMDLRVKDINATVDSIRKLTAGVAGTVTDLSISAGSPDGSPEPLASGSGGSGIGSQPSSAHMTLRVPSARLTEVEGHIGSLGTVLAQTKSDSDVTQQHIDLAARLTNLRAEEARLRDLLGKAGKISDLLEVERELARVRGDIESMQAQLSYLERQAAMATLTISMSQPGSLVRPSGTDWGIGAAVTTGVQAAAGVVRVLIATIIALSPLALITLIVWAVVRALLRRRARRREASQPASPQAPPQAPPK